MTEPENDFESPPPVDLYATMREDELVMLVGAFMLDAEMVADPRSAAFIAGRIDAIRAELVRRRKTPA